MLRPVVTLLLLVPLASASDWDGFGGIDMTKWDSEDPQDAHLPGSLDLRGFGVGLAHVLGTEEPQMILAVPLRDPLDRVTLPQPLGPAEDSYETVAVTFGQQCDDRTVVYPYGLKMQHDGRVEVTPEESSRGGGIDGQILYAVVDLPCDPSGRLWAVQVRSGPIGAGFDCIPDCDDWVLGERFDAHLPPLAPGVYDMNGTRLPDVGGHAGAEPAPVPQREPGGGRQHGDGAAEAKPGERDRATPLPAVLPLVALLLARRLS